MIRKLKVKNFKSFAEIDIELKNFNVLIGKNASGKSNFVSLLKFFNDYKNLGLENAVSLSGGAKFLKNLSLSKEDLDFELDFTSEFVRNVFKLSNEDRSEFVLQISGTKCDKVKKSLIRLIVDSGKEKLFEFDLLNLNSEGLKNLVGANRDKNEEIFLELMKIHIQQPKFLPKISVFDFEPKVCKKAIPLSSKFDLEMNGGNLPVVLQDILNENSKRQKLQNLLNFVLPFILDIKLVSQGLSEQILIKIKEKFNEEYIPANLISDGTINIILLIVALFFEKQEIVVIEEPTKELHPKLIPAIIELLRDASKKKQIIVTTQNPEFIKYVDVDDLIFVSRTEEGFSKIDRLSDKQKIKSFLENEIGLNELFIQNIFEGVV